MIGIAGYLCEDFCPDLGREPFVFMPGALRETAAMTQCVGGVVGNTGGALCRLGVPVRLGGAIGHDFLGKMIRASLREFCGSAVELMLETADFGNSGYAIVLNPAGSDRMFLACRGVNDQLTAASFGPEFRRGIRLLHFGYPPLCRKMAENGGTELCKLFAACRAERILTSLDLSLPSPGSFSYTLDWLEFLKRVLPLTDLFTPSIDELRFMLKDADSAPECLVESALKLGATAVLLKMGMAGMLLRVADTENAERQFARFGSGTWRGFQEKAAPLPVSIINTTGAGDSAIAGFLAGIYNGLDGHRCLKLANRIAAYRISSLNGIQGIPPLEKIL